MVDPTSAGPTHRIAITNMTGARNRGCEALVASIVCGLSQNMDPNRLRLSLHTSDPVYDREQLSTDFEAILGISNVPSSRMQPGRQRRYYGAARWMGRSPLRRFVPRSVADGLRADLLIATGGDTFTSDYGGFAKHARTLQFGTPVAMLGQTIGPFNKADAKLFVASMRNIAICTVRESETLEYIAALAPQIRPELTADVAFLLPATEPAAARAIIEVDNRFPIGDRRLIGLSVSTGIVSYRRDLDPERYLTEIAAFVDDLNRDGWSVLLLPHVQENWKTNNDVYACRDVFRRLTDQKSNAILYAPMSASDFKGVIGHCEVLVGGRMHTNIAAMSQGVPTVAIAYSRKSWAIMRDYYGETLGTGLTIDVAKLDRDQLRSAFDLALSTGETRKRAKEMQLLATRNFVRIRDFFQTPQPGRA